MRFFIILIFALIITSIATGTEEHPTLPIGSKAPAFSLKGVDGKTYSLASFSKYRILVIIFTCNHCPTAQAYEERMIQLTKDYSAKSVAVVAVSPNDPKSIRLDELGYTDMSDSYAEMKLRAFAVAFLILAEKKVVDRIRSTRRPLRG